jgi:hypothetical protein
METVAGRLRFFQIACLLMLLVTFGASRLARHVWAGKFTAVHWILSLAAIGSAVSGFTLQRRIGNRSELPRQFSANSTPFTRWRAGHIWRMWSATMVGGWALLLSEFAGPPLLVNVFFVVALLLLLAWTPGAVPAQAE